MKTTVVSLLCTLLFACASGDSEPEPEIPKVVTNVPTTPYNPVPEPTPVKECVVTRTTKIRDCTLYDLICDDGETDMVLLCPIKYWERGPYIPLPQ